MVVVFAHLAFALVVIAVWPAGIRVAFAASTDLLAILNYGNLRKVARYFFLTNAANVDLECLTSRNARVLNAVTRSIGTFLIFVDKWATT